MGKVIVFDRWEPGEGEPRVLSCRWWADWKQAEVEREFEEQQEIARRSQVVEIRLPRCVAYMRPGVQVITDE
jgi:hypothetical protein